MRCFLLSIEMQCRSKLFSSDFYKLLVFFKEKFIAVRFSIVSIKTVPNYGSELKCVITPPIFVKIASRMPYDNLIVYTIEDIEDA